MNEALAAQKEEPKKIFLDAYTNWCGPCKLLDKRTFSNKDVVSYVNKHFYAVKFNAEGNEKVNYKGKTYDNPHYNPDAKHRNSQHTFAKELNIGSYPTMVFFDEQGKPLTLVTAYKTPQQLEIYLKVFATNDYKKLTSADAWKKYQESFKPTFTN